MEIAVTGANGFIAKNFIYNFSHTKKYKINKITRNTSKKKIINILKKSKIIYHLAGANRPIEDKSFKKDNVELTKFICDFLIKKKMEKKIIFSSSTQVSKNNSYGKSKKVCEKLLLNLAKKNNSKVFILRLPNIYGKWSKPNYNSAVSTFCNNIANNKRINISNPKKILNLLYIDDLIKIFKKLIDKKNSKRKNIIIKFNNTKKISLKKLADTIYDFENKRNQFYIGDISSDFKRKLYSTYVTYLPKSKISYLLKSHKDERGSFTEFLKTLRSGQFSFFTAKKGKIRGHHFHHSKVEKFLVLKGKAKFNLENISNNKKISFKLDGAIPKVVESIPGHQHYIQNTGKEELLVLIWSNEIFDVNNPDTFRI